MSLKYQIIDHYADMLNYEFPFKKYFYEVTSAVTDGIYIVNHLNFNPANMLTHNGIFFDNIVEEHAYFFTQNEKHTLDQNTMAAGRTTVYISHRLSSTRFCDKVAMFDNGSLIEYGTHEELLEKKGKYSEIFEVQAQ